MYIGGVWHDVAKVVAESGERLRRPLLLRLCGVGPHCHLAFGMEGNPHTYGGWGPGMGRELAGVQSQESLPTTAVQPHLGILAGPANASNWANPPVPSNNLAVLMLMSESGASPAKLPFDYTSGSPATPAPAENDQVWAVALGVTETFDAKYTT